MAMSPYKGDILFYVNAEGLARLWFTPSKQICGPSEQEKGFTAVLVVHEANRAIGYDDLAPTAIVPSMLPRS
jgi:hypothetical protein